MNPRHLPNSVQSSQSPEVAGRHGSDGRALEVIRGLAAKHLGRRPRDDESLIDAGLDSLSAIDLRNSIQNVLLSSSATRLSATIVYDHPTIIELAQAVGEFSGSRMESTTQFSPVTLQQHEGQQQQPSRAGWKMDVNSVNLTTSNNLSKATTLENSMADVDSEQHVYSLLQRVASGLLGKVPDPDSSLVTEGLDSLMSIEFRNLVQQQSRLVERLPPSLVYDHPTLREMAQFLVPLFQAQGPTFFGGSASIGGSSSVEGRPLDQKTLQGAGGQIMRQSQISRPRFQPSPQATTGSSSLSTWQATNNYAVNASMDPASHLQQWQSPSFESSSIGKPPDIQTKSGNDHNADVLTITGIGCRLPGRANTPAAFWNNLMTKTDCIVPVPHDRFDIDLFFDPVPGTEGKTYVDQAGFLDDIDAFDRSLFPNISPSQILQMDPQQRLSLQVAKEALRDAGYEDIGRLKGSATGVFVGVCSNDWNKVKKDPSFLGGGFDVAGGANSMIANRISFEFGLKGPSMAIDTACSSSLQAVDLARRAMLNGQCER